MVEQRWAGHAKRRFGAPCGGSVRQVSPPGRHRRTRPPHKRGNTSVCLHNDATLKRFASIEAEFAARTGRILMFPDQVKRKPLQCPVLALVRCGHWPTIQITANIGSVGQQHRHCGMFQHVAGGPAKDGFAQAGMAVSPHHQQIGPLIAHVAQQHVRNARR